MFSLSRGVLQSIGPAILAMGIATPFGAQAQMPNCGVPPMGSTCGQPPDVCTCTTYKPVVDTCYHQQPITTYKDVNHTCYRQEQYCVSVPVTKYDCVRVDQGCYKMVWCPNVITKQVPRTEMRQQVCTRSVPYTVSQRVPQTTVQTIPEYRVHYVPQTHTFVKPPTPSCAQPLPNCAQPVLPGINYGGPMGSAAPIGGPMSMVQSAPVQQAMPANEGLVQPPNGPMAPVPQMSRQGQPAESMDGTVASTNAPTMNQFARARAAGNVWQASRGFAQPQ
jgi:hypothetical protein